MKNWFEIDRNGLAKILQRKGKETLVFELFQNAFDEDGVTTVCGALCEDSSPGHARLTVHDDAPNGFADLSHSWTLFAESSKKSNPEKRGRFNLGEKLVLALAKEAAITTTTGKVFFDENGRHRSPKRREAGSEIEVVVKMTRAEIAQVTLACAKLIPPPGINTVFNSRVLTAPTPLADFVASLTTEIADVEGNLVKVVRQTTVRVYPANTLRPAAIYEMGIPVCEIDGKFIFDVGQKVPLTMDREEVLPKFRKELAVAALNCISKLMDAEDVNTAWATQAVTSSDAKPEALEDYMTKRFGPKRVSFDPSDPEANHRAVSEGYVVVTGSQLSKEAWANVKSASAILPAGQVTPSDKPYSKDGKPLNVIQPDKYMLEVEEYARKFAREVLHAYISVTFVANATWRYSATYGPGDLTFNVGVLGTNWFRLKQNQEKIDNLLIHEFGHHYSLNHLSSDYYDALTRVGAGLARAIREGRM